MGRVALFAVPGLVNAAFHYADFTEWHGMEAGRQAGRQWVCFLKTPNCASSMGKWGKGGLRGSQGDRSSTRKEVGSRVILRVEKERSGGGRVHRCHQSLKYFSFLKNLNSRQTEGERKDKTV